MIRIDRDEASAKFFDGTAAGVLLIRRCRDCGAMWAPQVAQCPQCAAEVLEWHQAAGTATLVSWSVPRDRDGTVRAIAGLVELTEGPWLRAQIVGAAQSQLAAGLPLTVRFERPDGSGASEPGGEVIPVFQPAHDQEYRS